MKLAIPNTKVVARIFEPVQTVDEQYDIVDLGFEYQDGGIDSLAVGGSFHSLKQAVHKNNADIGSTKSDPTPEPDVAVTASQPAPITDRSGNDVDVEGL